MNHQDQDLNILLIDINGLGYAAMYQPELAKLSHNGKSTSAIYGAVSSVFSLMNKFESYHPIVLWDGRADWRYQLYPEYKSNRSEDQAKVEIREKYNAQVPDIKRLLSAAGIPQILHPGCEADDLVGIITRMASPGSNIIMCAKDTDWWQALQVNTSWYSNVSKNHVYLETLSSGELKEGSFSTPQQYITAKALSGDDSDFISGIPGVGSKTAVKFLDQYGSVESMWAEFDAGVKMSGDKLNKIAGPDYRDVYRRNLKLMDWKLGDPIDGSQAKFQYKERDEDKFQSICDEFNIKKFPAGVPDVSDYTYTLMAIKEIILMNDLSPSSTEVIEPAKPVKKIVF